MAKKKVIKKIRGYTKKDGTRVKGHTKKVEKKMASSGSKKKYKYTRPIKKTRKNNKYRNQFGQLTKSKNGKTTYRKSMTQDRQYRAKPVGKRTTSNPHRYQGKLIRKSTTYFENRANRSDTRISMNAKGNDRGGIRQSWHYRK